MTHTVNTRVVTHDALNLLSHLIPGLWFAQILPFYKYVPILLYLFNRLGSSKANGRELKSCLGRVLNSKAGSFARLSSKCMECLQPSLKLKIQPKFCPFVEQMKEYHQAR